MNACYSSDKGKIKIKNEDSIYCNEKTGLYIIADGLSGHLGGDIASKIAVETVSKKINDELLSCNEISQEFITNTLQNTNDQILNEANLNSEYEGMKTTIVMAIVKNDSALISHIGDSRAYLINNNITRITKDHSLIEEMIDLGKITREKSENHPMKHVILKVLGQVCTVEPDFKLLTLSEGDSLLLCSDGLTNLVSDDEILRIINETNSSDTCKKLVQTANAAGGLDNISVILINN